MRPLLSCLLVLALAACAQREARYTGTLTPEGGCGAAGQATLTVLRGQAMFTPNDGAVVIPGEVAADGKLTGQLVRPGVDKKPFAMTLDGTVTEDVATGVYATPRCRFSLLLTRAHLGLSEGLMP